VRREVLNASLASAIDGRRCLDHVRQIGAYDRSLGSSGYHSAGAYVRANLDRIGLDARVITWPMDDSPVPWNWSVPRAWEPRAASFRVLSPEERTLVTFARTPTCIHPWSAATPREGVIAEIVHVGDGTSDQDYLGKDVRGKIVFADRGANWLAYVHAVEKRGALGYVSDDILAVPHVKARQRFQDAVLWYTFYERETNGGPIRGWGISISPRMGDYLRGLLAQGPVTGHCMVEARTFDGVMENILGTIEGNGSVDEEFLCMAHLDHYRPGAMDNASGCSVLLEAAEVLNRLIARGSLPRPRRSIRFLFGPEGHTSNVYPHSLAERIDRLVGSWTADTVGARSSVVGGPLIFTRASASTPTYLSDLGPDLLKESCRWYPGMDDSPISTGAAENTVIHTKPGTSPFKFDTIPYGIHSDNACIAGWGVPAVGIFQWPATPWHTQYDTIEKLDAQELARCAWATASVSYLAANAGPLDGLGWMHDVRAAASRRLSAIASRGRASTLAGEGSEVADELRYACERDSAAIASCLAVCGEAAARERLALTADTLSTALRAECESQISTLADMARLVETMAAGD
jgi:hypothetical protein